MANEFNRDIAQGLRVETPGAPPKTSGAPGPDDPLAVQEPGYGQDTGFGDEADPAAGPVTPPHDEHLEGTGPGWEHTAGQDPRTELPSDR